jgi:predicted house-cleaning noncanonical NTP pyrophosphatase (MazG superfamily)
MDIRSAQKIAWDAGRPEDLDTDDISTAFDLLGGKVAKAFDAWNNDRTEMTDELAAIAIFLLTLAEMVGTDLQEVVEAKLDVDKARIPMRSPGIAPMDGPLATETTGLKQGKLVRDKIPQIIRSKGQEPVIYIADSDEYCIRLRDKLQEEVQEYLVSDNDREELADILEVLYALARQAGTDQEQLEKLRAAKAEKRGGFADRIIWFHNRNAAAVSGIGMAAVEL